MNAVFFIVFLFSAVVLFFLSPETILSALLSGASGAASLCLALLSSYCVWLGLMRLWEECGVTKKISALLKPAVKKLFHIRSNEAAEAVCMNLSANMLGIGGAATPYGIRAANLFEREEDPRYSSSMLFVLNATSLQIIPTSIVALRTSLQSAAPAAVILPALLSTAFSTVLGAVMVCLFLKKRPKTARIKNRKRRAV